MSKYTVYECDRCGKNTKSEEWPPYWMEVQIVRNANYPSDSGAYFYLCDSCGKRVRSELERKPEAA